MSDTTLASPVIRCAEWTLTAGFDPVGTAGDYAAYLLVEWPLPWPRDLSEIEALAALRPALSETRCRLQALVPRPDSATRRVTCYRRPLGEFFSGYVRYEVEVAPDEVAGGALDLLVSEPGATLSHVASGARQHAHPQTSTPQRRLEGSTTAGATTVGGAEPDHDVIVCTHGRRDRCCGSMGTELALALLADPERLGADTRVARTSHTGGHRYAPTAIVFPEGSAWAFADAELLNRVVHRDGPVAGVLPHYRGCAGVGGPAAQALEREVLAQVGWDLFDLPRRSEDLGDGRARLHVEGRGVWEATATTGRTLPMPDCGGPVDVAVATARELATRDFRQVA